MSEDFIPESIEPPNPPNASNTNSEPSPKREPLKVLLIGSNQGVKDEIVNLYKRGFAEVKAWSPLQPTTNPGEFVSILQRLATA